MLPRPTMVKAYPSKTKDMFLATELFCTGCEVGCEYKAREQYLHDMLHPTGAVLIGEREGSILSDPLLCQLRDICHGCLKLQYPELLNAIQHPGMQK